MKNKRTCNLIVSLFCLLVMTITGCKDKTPEATGGKGGKGSGSSAQRAVPVTADTG